MEEDRSTGLSDRFKCLGGLALCLLALVACPDVRETVPPQLRGIWVAEGERYEGRIMLIERERITFDSGLGETVAHPVLGVFTERREEETRYALDYATDSGGEYRLHLIYEPASGQIRLANRQQVVWTRGGS